MAEPFVDMVLRELDLKLTMHEHAKLALKELHLGGGSPTWLEGKLLLKLMKGILDRFPHSSSSRELSIEIDPRTFTEDHAGALQQVGVTRVSLGVQDFHLPTLRAIKRDQPYSVVETAVKRLAKLGVPYNFDLVYGLPHQSKESIEETFRKVVDLGVSRIALYSYAHIPSSKKAQIGVEKHGLPDVTSKRALYETARKILKNSSYLEIGMDHFALPEDELSVAAKNGSLHRNFMGYTVQRTKLLLGLGPSSLSDSWYAFAQNEKESTKWFESIQSGRLDPIAGHLLTEADQERRTVILDLMCRYQAKIKPELWERISRSTLPSDNLVTWNPGSCDLTVTEEGKPFIRNICAVLDDHIQAPQSAPAFSRAI